MSRVAPMPSAPRVEQVAPPYGGFWIRFAASLVDGVVLTVIFLVVSYLTGTNIFSLEITQQGNTHTVKVPPSWGLLLSALIPAIYTIGFWLQAGATPGKMLFQLRVVRADTGRLISIGQALKRYLGYYVSAVVFLLGYIWAAFDARKQSWHDKLASTVVLRRSAPVAPILGAGT